MRKPSFSNKELDTIGKKLVRGTCAASVDIERIVSNTRLYDMVRSRIAQDADGPLPTVARRPRFALRYAAAAAAVLVAISVSLGLLLMSDKNSNYDMVDVVKQVPEAIPVREARPDHPPKPMFSKLPSGRAFQNKTTPKPAQAKTKQIVKPRPTEPGDIPHSEFYAISFAGDLEETAAGGRIVRVEMPRSSLFAMGVDIPLENGRDIVKTDVLIGSDGMAKAVRIVE